MFLFDDISGVVGNIESWTEQQWSQRIVQVSVYAAVLYLVMSHWRLVNWVEKNANTVLNIKLGKDGTQVVHAVIFGLFMYLGTRFILDPMVKRLSNGAVVEGLTYDEAKRQADELGKCAEKANEGDCGSDDDGCIWTEDDFGVGGCGADISEDIRCGLLMTGGAGTDGEENCESDDGCKPTTEFGEFQCVPKSEDD